jgi:hypothetical protein
MMKLDDDGMDGSFAGGRMRLKTARTEATV